MEEKTKFLLRKPVQVLLIYVILLIGLYIHELSHGLMAIFYSGECLEVNVNPFTLTGYCKVRISGDEVGRRVYLAGSFGAILFGICVIKIADNLNNLTISFGGHFLILSNIGYWFLKGSDYRQFVDTLDSKVDIMPIIIMLLICFIIEIILWATSVIKFYRKRMNQNI